MKEIIKSLLFSAMIIVPITIMILPEMLFMVEPDIFGPEYLRFKDGGSKAMIRHEQVSGTIVHVEYFSVSQVYPEDTGDYCVVYWKGGGSDYFREGDFGRLKELEGKEVVLDIWYNQAYDGYFNIEGVEIIQ